MYILSVLGLAADPWLPFLGVVVGVGFPVVIVQCSLEQCFPDVRLQIIRNMLSGTLMTAKRN